MKTFRSMAKLLPLPLIAGLIVSLPGAGAVASSAGSQKNGTFVRSVRRGAALPLPTAHQGAPITDGIQSPEFPPGEGPGGDRASGTRGPVVNRSYSRRPDPNSTRALGAPVVPSTGVFTPTDPKMTRSWQGLDLFDQRFANNGNQFTVEPPDQGLCAGNGFVMETINDVIQFFDTSGNPLTGAISQNEFYGYPPEINRETGEFGPFPTDPSCIFDPHFQRWFNLVLTLEQDPVTGDLTGKNHLDLAVSQSSDPTDGWVIYRIPVQDDGTNGTPSHPDCPCVGDYPHIGTDTFGFFISTNEYPFGSGPGVFGNNYNGAQLYALPKEALADNDLTVPVVQYENLVEKNGTPGFTVWPAQASGQAWDTSHGGTEWFLETSATEETLNPSGFDNHLGVWRLTQTSRLNDLTRGEVATPVLKNTVLKSKEYGVPAWSEQKQGPVPLRDCLTVDCLGLGARSNEVEGPLDSLDSRMQQTWLVGGQLVGSWGTIANVDGSHIQAGVMFAAVDTAPSLADVSIAKQGYLAVDGNLIMPAVAIPSGGNGLMAFTLVGSSYFPTAGYIRFNTSGPSGPVRIASAGKGPEDGFCEYLIFDCAGTPTPAIRPRWGDYGAAVTQGDSVWIASEYIGQKCTFAEYEADLTCGLTRAPLGNWSTRISKVTP